MVRRWQENHGALFLPRLRGSGRRESNTPERQSADRSVNGDSGGIIEHLEQAAAERKLASEFGEKNIS